MTDIDHAAEARKILHDVESAEVGDNLPFDWCGASDDEQWLVHASLEEAQVHATLALVEQQRIANLVALYTNPSADVAAAMEDSGVNFLDLLGQIKKELGL